MCGSHIEFCWIAPFEQLKVPGVARSEMGKKARGGGESGVPFWTCGIWGIYYKPEKR